MSYTPALSHHYHRIDLMDPEMKLHIYPSGVDVVWPDGCHLTIDVGILYALMGVHLRQNGVWDGSDPYLDWAKLVANGWIKCAVSTVDWREPARYRIERKP